MAITVGSRPWTVKIESFGMLPWLRVDACSRFTPGAIGWGGGAAIVDRGPPWDIRMDIEGPVW